MQIILDLKKEKEIPLYRQVYRQVRDEILSGRLPAGSKLPPTRRLAAEHDVARITITQAYDQLQAEGYVTARPGSGTFVSKSLPGKERSRAQAFAPSLSNWGQRILQQEGTVRRGGSPRERAGDRDFIDFSFGRSFPHIFPYDVWRRLLARYLSTDDAMLSRYGSAAGFMPLRQAIADYVRRLRGVRCEVEQVVVVNGAQQALDILARLLLNQGDTVLVETPGYTDAFTLFRVNGARLLALPVDEDGFPVSALPTDVSARLVFVTPANQFPRGGAMPLPRRLALLQWARAHNAFILEDDYDGALRYEDRPLAALQGVDENGHVIYLGSFSKVLFPALRLGYVVLPQTLLTPYLRAKSIVDRGSPTLTQAAVADFITEGHFERHLRRLREVYGRRRAVLITALHALLPCKVRFSDEPAGLHVMLYLPARYDEARIVEQAAAAGVGVYPGAGYHLEPDPPPSILLGFSGLSADEIEEGVRRLSTVLC